MNKEFVPYNESLELKELGFDEPTLYHWHKSSKENPFTNEVFNPNCRPRTNSGIKDIGDENHVWSAPTFSQAFRWFREKCGIDYEIPYAGKRGEYHAFVKSFIYGDNSSSPSIFSYEEAELTCLRKLIEICKTKN